ncbi:MAG: DMT family transporter [Burkholderiaceae bacterium]
MNRPLWIGTLCFLGASMAWGANIPLTAILFQTFDPFFMALLRLIIATAVLVVIIGAGPGGWRMLAMPIGPRRYLLLSASMAGFFLLYNLGLKYTHPITAAAIMAATPVYAALSVRVATRQPLEPGFWIAATLSVIGTGIAIAARSPQALASLRLEGGEILIVLSYGCWNAYSITAQRWFEPSVSQVRRTYVAMTGTTLWLALAWAAMRAVGAVDAPNLSPPPEAVLWLLLTAVFASGLSVVAWNIGVSRAGLAAGSLWQNMVPVFGVLTAMLFGILPTAGQVIGGLIVIAGVLYMQWRRSQSPVSRSSGLVSRS